MVIGQEPFHLSSFWFGLYSTIYTTTTMHCALKCGTVKAKVSLSVFLLIFRFIIIIITITIIINSEQSLSPRSLSLSLSLSFSQIYNISFCIKCRHFVWFFRYYSCYYLFTIYLFIITKLFSVNFFSFSSSLEINFRYHFNVFFLFLLLFIFFDILEKILQ